ncbi:MAG TPA: hypothetical protein VGB05_06700, partial [Pyrinomonadaceae bacterium]
MVINIWMKWSLDTFRRTPLPFPRAHHHHTGGKLLMSKMMRLNRWTISIAGCSVLACSALALNVNHNGNQSSHASNNQDKHAVVRQVEESPDRSLRVAGNDDCPLRLIEAKVKEVPAALFTRLTGKVTDLATVSSVPEATLVNNSGQTV